MGVFFNYFLQRILLTEENILICDNVIIPLRWWLISHNQPDVEFIILLNLNHSCVQVQFYHSGSYVHFFQWYFESSVRYLTSKVIFSWVIWDSSLKWAVFLKSSRICHFSKSGISKKRESQFSLKWNKEQAVSLFKINILIVYVVPAHGLQIGDKLHSPDYFPSCQGQMKPHSIKGMWFTQTLEGSQCWPVGSSSQLISVCFSLPFSTIRLFDWNFLKGRRRTQIW